MLADKLNKTNFNVYYMFDYFNVKEFESLYFVEPIKFYFILFITSLNISFLSV